MAAPGALQWVTEYTGRTLTFTRPSADSPWERCVVDQHAYIREKLSMALVEEMRKHCALSGANRARNTRLLTPEGCEAYRSMVGALMWGVQTNPELGETASELAGGLQCPTAADAVLLADTVEHLNKDPGSIVLHRLVGARLDVLSHSDSSLITEARRRKAAIASSTASAPSTLPDEKGLESGETSRSGQSGANRMSPDANSTASVSTSSVLPTL